MNEPPVSIEYEPPEQIDPAFTQLYDRIEELEIEMEKLKQKLAGIKSGRIVCCCPLNSFQTHPSCPLHGTGA